LIIHIFAQLPPGFLLIYLALSLNVSSNQK
jgi:hypothetical protein